MASTWCPPLQAGAAVRTQRRSTARLAGLRSWAASRPASPAQVTPYVIFLLGLPFIG